MEASHNQARFASFREKAQNDRKNGRNGTHRVELEANVEYYQLRDFIDHRDIWSDCTCKFCLRI